MVEQIVWLKEDLNTRHLREATFDLAHHGHQVSEYFGPPLFALSKDYRAWEIPAGILRNILDPQRVPTGLRIRWKRSEVGLSRILA